ncbi:hypothetical protein [Leptospira kirschneri]|uniref:hypothetical protein n=1 Tax=Leptospira kirschneri TaxID=29507 RepID=UPI0009B7E5C5|nr:hypothetical protein [Leptospira kirschneri]
MNELKHNALYHNLTHKYLDFNIKSCGNYDKSSVKLSSRPYFWVGQLNELLPMGRNSGGEIRKTFLYQKNMLFASKKTHSCRNT